MNQPSIPLLDLSQVNYSVDGKHLIKGIDWDVFRGQHWAILGPNGSGKTTLLRIASGYQWPDVGSQVRRLGEELQDLRELRKSIGWVTAELSSQIPPREPVLDTVISGRLGQIGLQRILLREPIDASVIKEAKDQLLLLGAERLEGQAFGTLSQGERQKVLIARALMAKPLIVFLDEPCAGLDPGAREQFLFTLEQLASQIADLSLVFVTHHVEEILPAFTNTLAMKKGRLVKAGKTASVIAPGLLSELYDVNPPEIVQRNGRYWPLW